MTRDPAPRVPITPGGRRTRGPRAFNVEATLGEWEPCGIPPFPELPMGLRNVLVRAGFVDPQEVMETSDTALIRTPGLGRSGIILLRQVYPFADDATDWMPCPCCNGAGRVIRFALIREARARARPRAEQELPDASLEEPR